jgi:hypothetical protein
MLLLWIYEEKVDIPLLLSTDRRIELGTGKNLTMISGAISLEIIENRYERRSTIITSQAALDRYTKSPQVQRWPMPSSITSITSISPAKACEK